MVIDTILYNGEQDLLEIRLNVLWPVVDKFVIVEAFETFSGKPKPFYFEQQFGRFAIYSDKLIYHKIYAYPDEKWAEAKASPNTGGLDHWCREFAQREAIKDALATMNLSDDDTIFMGDCDEIWNASSITLPSPSKLKLQVYSYFLNLRSDESFAGTIMAEYRDIKHASLNHLRSGAQWTKGVYGWHFTSMGGIDELKRKIESYGHQEYNNDYIKDNLEARINAGKDYIGRDFRLWVDESDWPDYLKINRNQYAHLIK